MVLNPLKVKILAGVGVAAALIMAGLFVWGTSWKWNAQALQSQANAVVEAIRSASENPDVTWDTAASQIVLMGDSRRRLLIDIDNQNKAIDEMAEEAVRLKAEARELRKIADRARAQRSAAYKQLEDMTISPGTREDCRALIQEANDALDTVYRAAVETGI